MVICTVFRFVFLVGLLALFVPILSELSCVLGFGIGVPNSG